MPKVLRLSSARAEVANAKVRHVEILNKARAHCVTENPEKDGFLYLMAIPMMYAAWEGYFKLVCTVCLKRKCISGQKAKKYPASYLALWLQKEGFIQAYLQNLVNSMQLGRPARAGSGQYSALTSLAADMAGWLEQPVNHAQPFGDLVMTFSNVNNDVVELNASVIGLDISNVAIGRLHELVGRRNEIAHGGLLSYPTELQTVELMDYTALLINQFDDAVVDWLRTN